MAKFCPITNKNVIYMTCLECDDKICKKEKIIITEEELNEKKNEEITI